mmetsp:Transcript_33315/g.87344  ORF Transcript_33315/g.87344 Transcript_33315/m.87344 type:complete len:207 (+) Transcript_33315:1847-2467(+)
MPIIPVQPNRVGRLELPNLHAALADDHRELGVIHRNREVPLPRDVAAAPPEIGQYNLEEPMVISKVLAPLWGNGFRQWRRHLHLSCHKRRDDVTERRRKLCTSCLHLIVQTLVLGVSTEHGAAQCIAATNQVAADLAALRNALAIDCRPQLDRQVQTRFDRRLRRRLVHRLNECDRRVGVGRQGVPIDRIILPHHKRFDGVADGLG